MDTIISKRMVIRGSIIVFGHRFSNPELDKYSGEIVLVVVDREQDRDVVEVYSTNRFKICQANRCTTDGDFHKATNQ